MIWNVQLEIWTFSFWNLKLTWNLSFDISEELKLLNSTSSKWVEVWRPQRTLKVIPSTQCSFFEFWRGLLQRKASRASFERAKLGFWRMSRAKWLLPRSEGHGNPWFLKDVSSETRFEPSRGASRAPTPEGPPKTKFWQASKNLGFLIKKSS